MFLINFSSEIKQYCKKLWPKDNTEANVVNEYGRKLYTGTGLTFSTKQSEEIIKAYSNPLRAIEAMKMVKEKKERISIGRLSNGFVVNYDPKKNKFFTNSDEEIIFVKK